MENPALIIMAAGMGSRFGGLKQITPVGDNGEIIMDFSLYDAYQAGFRKVVFSVVIMIIVLFFSKGIMGNKELSFAGLIRKIQAKKAAKAVKAEAGGAAK